MLADVVQVVVSAGADGWLYRLRCSRLFEQATSPGEPHLLQCGVDVGTVGRVAEDEPDAVALVDGLGAGAEQVGFAGHVDVSTTFGAGLIGIEERALHGDPVGPDTCGGRKALDDGNQGDSFGNAQGVPVPMRDEVPAGWLGAGRRGERRLCTLGCRSQAAVEVQAGSLVVRLARRPAWSAEADAELEQSRARRPWNGSATRWRGEAKRVSDGLEKWLCSGGADGPMRHERANG